MLYDDWVLRILNDCPNETLDTEEIKAIAEYNTFIPNGYNMTEGGKGGRATSRENADGIIKMYLNGDSLAEIVGTFGVCEKTIYNILQRNGIMTNRRETPIVKIDPKSGEIVDIFSSSRIVSDLYGLSKSSWLSFVLNGKKSRWQHFYWKKYDELSFDEIENMQFAGVIPDE